MPVIVISGKPACGSSTTAKMLAKKLGLAFFSLGTYTKSDAAKFVKRMEETERSAKFWNYRSYNNLKAQKKYDNIQIRLAKRGNIVIEAKLGVHMLGNLADLRIWLTAPFGIRAGRVAERDDIDLREAWKVLREKETLERKNWKNIYGFDYFQQQGSADIVIDTSDKTPEQIVDLIVSKIRRVFVVHRWYGTPGADWYPSAKQEMEKKGFLVNVLRMPHPSRPKLDEWLPHLAESIGNPNENTFLVGHSAGVATILSYLEKLKPGEKIGGCVLVAGWLDDLGYKQLSSFVNKPFNWAKIREHCKKFVTIDSDNDPYVKPYHGRGFQKKLKAKLITEHKKGHLDDDSKIKKLPSVVKSVESMAK